MKILFIYAFIIFLEIQESSQRLGRELRDIVEGMQGPESRDSESFIDSKMLSDLEGDNESQATLYSASMHSVLQVKIILYKL